MDRADDELHQYLCLAIQFRQNGDGLRHQLLLAGGRWFELQSLIQESRHSFGGIYLIRQRFKRSLVARAFLRTDL